LQKTKSLSSLRQYLEQTMHLFSRAFLSITDSHPPQPKHFSGSVEKCLTFFSFIFEIPLGQLSPVQSTHRPQMNRPSGTFDSGGSSSVKQTARSHISQYNNIVSSIGTSPVISHTLQLGQRQLATADADMLKIGTLAQKEWYASPQSTQKSIVSAAPDEPQLRQDSIQEQK